MDARYIEQLVREVLKQMSNVAGEENTPAAEAGTQAGKTGCALHPGKDYPLAEKRPELIRTATGKKLEDLTIENVLNGKITPQDVRITADALLMQARIAEACGRKQLAQNFRRAAELTGVPDERILEIYNALRPYRSTRAELLAIADELEHKYGARINAAFVREAADVYERRGRLRTA
ncbi:diol dehydratase small subunit [Desulfofundulus salinus]|uniref:Diol dehydratase small subunit n=1 Tax=Desulfofundulus salinus TaxID=2419843 RepID=A0A494X3X6_9FIRM|nr:diol dehydratase small subunit [Desulfofundulus salinum]RKO67865.1 diol dehydratase small subunit [Desulfofundulus salinum]